jgi:transcriptional regulator with XRE-family HTH domain
MMEWSKVRNEILSNPIVKKEYEKINPEYEIIRAVLNARKTRNLTQQQLADRTGINRADISRIENGNSNPTIAQLQRIADGMDMVLKVEFVPKEKVGTN